MDRNHAARRTGRHRRRPALLILLVACSLLALGLLAVPAPAAGQAQWTFVVYMSSDNDLGDWAALNIGWLVSAPPSPDVNVLVFHDPAGGPAQLLKVGGGLQTRLSGFALDGREVNMGDPATLRAVVDYAAARFPARHVLVDLWDHGDDFRGICYDYDTAGAGEFDILSHQEIVGALAGRAVDVLAGDGCGIGTVETAYEYASGGLTAAWFVASETYVPLDGFPYDRIAADLVADPGMTPEGLARDIVRRYAEYYQGGWLTELSAVRLAAVPAVGRELWDVTALLTRRMRAYRGLVSAGRGKATMGWSQYGWEAFVDFPTVFRVVHDRAPSGSRLEAETADLLAALDRAVPYVGAGTPGEVWEFGGLAVFFPGSKGRFVHDTGLGGAAYPTMRFARDGWLDFLQAYYGKK